MRVATSSRQGPLAGLALLAIRGYQRRISPHKGFRCAHAALHGGSGCSGYAAEAIRARGLAGALGPIRQRFRDCRAAHAVLTSGQPDAKRRDDPGRKVDRRRPDRKDSDCPCADLPCGGPPSRRSCIADLAGHTGCGACSACDLGAIGCCG